MSIILILVLIFLLIGPTTTTSSCSLRTPATASASVGIRLISLEIGFAVATVLIMAALVCTSLKPVVLKLMLIVLRSLASASLCDSLNKYLKDLPQEEFETLDKTIQNVYYARIEASRIKEQYGCEPPLGFVRTTKAYTIPAKSHIGIHGLTKIKHGGWSVNVVNENPQITPLPHGLKTESTLSQLSPGSNRILVAMSNYSDQDISIPAKTIISQLSLGNKVPKMIYPGDDKDSELLDKDEGLKYEHFEQHKLISEELNLEPEEYIPTFCDNSCDKSHTVGS